MSFVGTANRIGDSLVRPHDVEIAHVPQLRSVEAMIDRIVHLGFEVRLELTLADDSPLVAQLTRAQVEELELGRRARSSTCGRAALACSTPTATIRGPRSWRSSHEPRRRIVAWAMFAVLIGWLGMVLYATFRTLDGEVREARAARYRTSTRPRTAASRDRGGDSNGVCALLGRLRMLGERADRLR